MASGRIINKKICVNRVINEVLSSDTCRLAFTWTIPYLDRDGRVNGDPSVLRSMVFPRRKDITDEQMEGFIKEWAENGLVLWYEADGDKWIQFPKFRTNQPHLRYERESESTIPGPEYGRYLIKPQKNPDKLRSESGTMPEQCRSNSGECDKNGSTVDNVGPEQCRSNSPVMNLMNLKNLRETPPSASPTEVFPEKPPPEEYDAGIKSLKGAVGALPQEVPGKLKDEQLREVAARLKVEDPEKYDEFIKKHPELKEDPRPKEVPW